MTRGREAAARQLLGIEAKGGPLRRVASLGQRARHGLALEMPAETRHVAQRIGHRRELLSQARTIKRARPSGEPRPFAGRGLATRRLLADLSESAVIDVDVDLVRNVDRGLVAPEA